MGIITTSELWGFGLPACKTGGALGYMETRSSTVLVSCSLFQPSFPNPPRYLLYMVLEPLGPYIVGT